MSPTTPRSGTRAFPETHWSQVFRAGNRADPLHREHLGDLMRRYWKPAYHYVRAMRAVSAADAEDLTQGFFTMMLSRVDFAALTPERGSFRGFIKVALRRFVVSNERKVSTQKERTAQPLFPFADAETGLPADIATSNSPDDAFDRAWAREVLQQMLAKLKTELEAEGKLVYFEIFRDYCLDPNTSVSYESVAAQHGLKADDVRNYLRVVRQRGREMLKEMVGEYLLPGENLDDELRFVLGGR